MAEHQTETPSSEPGFLRRGRIIMASSPHSSEQINTALAQLAIKQGPLGKIGVE